MMYSFISIQWTKNEKTLDECCAFEHKWKIARGYISKSNRRTRLKFSPWESTAMITLWAKFNRNLRCRVLFRDFFGRSVVECPICKYHFLCFVTIIQVKVISGHQVKKVKQFFSWFRVAIHVFRSDFRKERKKWPLTLFEASKLVKKLNSENHGKVPKWREKRLFYMFYVISQPILKISTLNFVHLFMRHCPLTYVTFFENFDLGGNCLENKKMDICFENFSKFSQFWKSEIAVL